MSHKEAKRQRIKDRQSGMTVVFDVPVFQDYVAPKGFLVNDIACHALFYYALTARGAYERWILEWTLQYEGNETTVPNFRNMFENIATMYGVNPERMSKHWSSVDMQMIALNLPQLPDEERYRFNRTPEIRTH